MFIAMGGFMGAAALAAKQGKRAKAAVAKIAPKRNTELDAFYAESDRIHEENTAQAEAELGRPETNQERIDREVAQFGFSMSNPPLRPRR